MRLNQRQMDQLKALMKRAAIQTWIAIENQDDNTEVETQLEVENIDKAQTRKELKELLPNIYRWAYGVVYNQSKKLESLSA